MQSDRDAGEVLMVSRWRERDCFTAYMKRSPPLAHQICARYQAEFPDEQQRYGAAGVQWCLYDNQYLLAWAFQDARDGTVVLSEQAAWLARVLAARDFPLALARLARDLEIAAEVTRGNPALGALADSTAQRLAAAAAAITSDQVC
jgi:hypothetical protein